MGRGLRSPTCVFWGRLREAAKDKDCTCFSRSGWEKVSEQRETEPWGWEGNDGRRAASCGESWRDLGCRMRDAGARTALFPWHTKGLVRDRTAVHLDDLGILGLPLPALSAPAGLLIPEPLGFQMAGVGCLSPELTLKCA